MGTGCRPTRRLGSIALIMAALWSITVAAASNWTIDGPILGGSREKPFGLPPLDLASRGYAAEEFFLSSDARRFELAPGQAQSPDGHWSTVAAGVPQRFVTRVLVIRRLEPKDFNGTVLTVWQDTTPGFETGLPWHDHMLSGFAIVLVSAQKIGIDGVMGPGANGLKQWDAERYGRLLHPGDGYSYAIFGRAMEAVSVRRANNLIGGLTPRRVVAVAAGQGATRLRAYINGVHQHHGLASGFLLLDDFGTVLPFVSGSSPARRSERARIRSDAPPVFVINSETATLSYIGARQPDSDRFRLWEVAGTSPAAGSRQSPDPFLVSPNWLSTGPVIGAALNHMQHWLVDGRTPPSMPRIQVDPDGWSPLRPGLGAIKRDGDGNAVGGVRLPELRVPTASHSGLGAPSSTHRLWMLYGQAQPFTRGQLRDRYPTRKRFLNAYREAVDDARQQGIILRADASALLDEAESWAVRNIPLR